MNQRWLVRCIYWQPRPLNLGPSGVGQCFTLTADRPSIIRERRHLGVLRQKKGEERVGLQRRQNEGVRHK